MKKENPPKKPFTISDGFRYSEEAKADLRKRAKTAKNMLNALCKKDPELKERISKLISDANKI